MSLSMSNLLDCTRPLRGCTDQLVNAVSIHAKVWEITLDFKTTSIVKFSVRLPVHHITQQSICLGSKWSKGMDSCFPLVFWSPLGLLRPNPQEDQPLTYLFFFQVRRNMDSTSWKYIMLSWLAWRQSYWVTSVNPASHHWKLDMCVFWTVQEHHWIKNQKTRCPNQLCCSGQ